MKDLFILSLFKILKLINVFVFGLRKMSANECELLLSKIIDIIIRYENQVIRFTNSLNLHEQIEDVRIQLAKNQYFFPSPSFKRIAIDGKGYLREEDLEGFLR